MTFCCINVLLKIAYLVDHDVYYNCDLIVPFMGWLARVMILLPAVHCFVCVVQPFIYSPQNFDQEKNYSDDCSTMGFPDYSLYYTGQQCSYI